MRSGATTALWMGSAFGAAAALAVVVIDIMGADQKGTNAALFLTGRLSFMLFWPAYTGSAMAELFGQTFLPLRRRAREFGLAFASAHLVHLGLVAWLCRIGAAPGTRPSSSSGSQLFGPTCSRCSQLAVCIRHSILGSGGSCARSGSTTLPMPSRLIFSIVHCKEVPDTSSPTCPLRFLPLWGQCCFLLHRRNASGACGRVPLTGLADPCPWFPDPPEWGA